MRKTSFISIDISTFGKGIYSILAQCGQQSAIAKFVV